MHPSDQRPPAYRGANHRILKFKRSAGTLFLETRRADTTCSMLTHCIAPIIRASRKEKLKTMKAVLIGLALLIVALALLIKAKGKGKSGSEEKPRAKVPLTKNEQPMYFRLKEALPGYEVLAQVAFSALLTARKTATRNSFDRKVADFVICTRSFEVVAVIELDDKSHKGKEAADAARDQMLIDAGYRVLRYAMTPNAEKVRKDIQQPQIELTASRG